MLNTRISSSIDMVKSRISALFGQKFHPKFPDQRRDCDDKCQCGYYPTECSRYGHPGVDLKLDPGWKVSISVAVMYPERYENECVCVCVRVCVCVCVCVCVHGHSTK